MRLQLRLRQRDAEPARQQLQTSRSAVLADCTGQPLARAQRVHGESGAHQRLDARRARSRQRRREPAAFGHVVRLRNDRLQPAEQLLRRLRRCLAEAAHHVRLYLLSLQLRRRGSRGAKANVSTRLRCVALEEAQNDAVTTLHIKASGDVARGQRRRQAGSKALQQSNKGRRNTQARNVRTRRERRLRCKVQEDGMRSEPGAHLSCEAAVARPSQQRRGEHGQERLKARRGRRNRCRNGTVNAAMGLRALANTAELEARALGPQREKLLRKSPRPRQRVQSREEAALQQRSSALAHKGRRQHGACRQQPRSRGNLRGLSSSSVVSGIERCSAVAVAPF